MPLIKNNCSYLLMNLFFWFRFKTISKLKIIVCKDNAINSPEKMSIYKILGLKQRSLYTEIFGASLIVSK